jgi:hypothetical protein
MEVVRVCDLRLRPDSVHGIRCIATQYHSDCGVDSGGGTRVGYPRILSFV